MFHSQLSANRKSAALLAALVVLVVPGGSLVVGALWVYRNFSRAMQEKRIAYVAASGDSLRR